MPAWNFKTRFADLVVSGAKVHTIRAPRKDGRLPKVGDPAYLYTGMRTRECRLLRVAKVEAVTDIAIFPTSGRIYIKRGSLNHRSGEGFLTEAENNRLARLDGFDGELEFFNWFEEYHGETFFAHLIEWAKAPADLLP